MSDLLKINVKKVGMLLLALYIFFSYTAQDVLLPSVLQTVFLYLFLGWGVYKIIRRMKITFFSYSNWYGLFFIYSIVIMLYAPKKDFFSNDSLYLILVTFVLTYFINTVIDTEEDFKCLCWCYGISALVFVAILYFSGNLIATASNRLGGDIVGNANTFAGMMMVAVMLEIWLLIYGTEKKILKICLLIMLCIDLYAMLLSGGRKFVIVPIIFLYLLLMMKRDSKGRVNIIRSTLLIIVIVVVLYTLIMKVPILYEIIGYRMRFLINSLIGIGEIGASASIRKVMRELAINGWMQSPLWGYGFDSFKYFNQAKTGLFVYSHCNFTEILYNGGLFYFVMYYSFFVWQLKKTWKLRKKIDVRFLAFSLSTMICLLVFEYGAVDYCLTNIQIMLCLTSIALKIGVRSNNTRILREKSDE